MRVTRVRWLAPAVIVSVLVGPTLGAVPAYAGELTGVTLVACYGSGTVDVYNASTHRRVDWFPVGIGAIDIVVAADGRRAFVANGLGGTVSLVDPGYHTTVVPVGRAPSALAVDPAGTTVYVANSGDGTVSVVD